MQTKLVLASVFFFIANVFIGCGDSSTTASNDTTESSTSTITTSSYSHQSNSSVEIGDSNLAIPCKTETEDKCEYGILVDNRDSQSYKTVKIANQWWMGENLAYEAADSYCLNNVDANCAKYGRLYTWNAAVKACPSGWHLPQKSEFKTLFAAIGSESQAGKMLETTHGWLKDGYGTDSYGFSALSGGLRYGNGDFGDEGMYAYFWTATEENSSSAYSIDLYYSRASAYLGSDYKTYAFSVRCVKD